MLSEPKTLAASRILCSIYNSGLFLCRVTVLHIDFLTDSSYNNAILDGGGEFYETGIASGSRLSEGEPEPG